jgi:hypothetical protein
VGDVEIVPASGSETRVVFTISGDERAVQATQVEAKFARASDGGLVVAAWESRAGRSVGFFDGRGASASVRIEVPETGAFDVTASADVGDVTLRGLLVGDVTLDTDVGDASVRDADVQGNVTIRTDVGDVDAGIASITNSTVRVTTDVGDAKLRLPSRADIGYDVKATADVGDVRLEIGPTESSDHTKEAPGETWNARSQGYSSKPAQVRVVVTTDVGSIDLEARA